MPAPDDVSASVRVSGVSRFGALARACAPWLGGAVLGSASVGAVVTQLHASPTLKPDVMEVSRGDLLAIADQAASKALAGIEPRLRDLDDRLAALRRESDGQRDALQAFDRVFKLQIATFSKELGDVKGAVGTVQGSLDVLIRMLERTPR